MITINVVSPFLICLIRSGKTGGGVLELEIKAQSLVETRHRKKTATKKAALWVGWVDSGTVKKFV